MITDVDVFADRARNVVAAAEETKKSLHTIFYKFFFSHLDLEKTKVY